MAGSPLGRIFKLLSGYGDSKSTGFRPLKAMQKRFYQWALMHPVFSFKAFHLFISPFIKETAMVQGHRMHLDKGDSLGLSVFGVFEPFMTKIIAGEIKEGDTVVDVGASIGYYTLTFARLVGEKGKVYAFEPAPDIFALLEKNVKENGYKNVILNNKAVSDKTGKARLYLCDYNNMAHTLSRTREGAGSVEVETVRLDDYFRDRGGKIDFVKIDVEGAECAAVRGMEQVLRASRSIKLATEYHPKWLTSFGSSGKEYLELISSLGFGISDINEGTEQVEPSDADKILKKYSPEKRTWTNLLCVK